MSLRRVAVIGLLASTALLAACKEEKRAAAPPVRPVISVVVAPSDETHEVFAGTIEPRFSSTLAFRVPGRIVGRDAEVGDLVAKDARLAVLDSVALDLAVATARADLADADAQRANAEASEKRLRTLVEQKTVSDAQYEAVEQAREATRAAVIRARSALDKALDQRSHADLVAEFDGMVTAVFAEPGQTVAPGQPIVTIARPDVREAVIDVPDEIAVSLTTGARFDVAIQTAPSTRVAGTVREIAPGVDATTKSRRVKISLEDPPPSFRLGTTITARLEESKGREITLPPTALLERGSAVGVWVVDPGTRTVALREVTIARTEGGRAIVTTGLAAGDRVVTVGVHSLEPGQKVVIPDGTPQ
jgi:RND family efflux transporter MFP subunit